MGFFTKFMAELWLNIIHFLGWSDMSGCGDLCQMKTTNHSSRVHYIWFVERFQAVLNACRVLPFVPDNHVCDLSFVVVIV